MRLRLLTMPVMVAVMMSCQSSQATAVKDPKVAFAGCLSRMKLTDISAKHELASFMGVSMERMPALFCQRLLNAALSGRLTLSDINRLQLSQPTEVWKIIKGR